MSRDEETALLLFYVTYEAQHGVPPTAEQCGAARGLPVGMASRQLRAARNEGRLASAGVVRGPARSMALVLPA